MIALFKAGHIASLAVWCAGLLVLPIILQIYGRRSEISTQPGFSEFRLLLHAGYTRIVTPAAILTIILGTGLILLTQLRAEWLLVKLGVVCVMVLLHAWLGHLILKTAEGRGSYQMPSPVFVIPGSLFLIGIVLVLVLSKPDLSFLSRALPDFLREPQGRDLPSDFTPI